MFSIVQKFLIGVLTLIVLFLGLAALAFALESYFLGIVLILSIDYGIKLGMILLAYFTGDMVLKLIKRK